MSMTIRPAMPRPLVSGVRAATIAAAAPAKPQVSKKPEAKPAVKAAGPSRSFGALDIRVIGSGVGSAVIGGVGAAMLFAGGGAGVIVPAVIVGACLLGACGLWCGALFAGVSDGRRANKAKWG